jgi:hypothetical protein
MSIERQEIHEKLAPHLRKGEQVYYEIYGFSKDGGAVQSSFSYGCEPHTYKAMLYRVTVTTPDGFCVDLPRQQVYRRAQELGLEVPYLLWSGYRDQEGFPQIENLLHWAEGRSAFDLNTIREGIVVWFMNIEGRWDCLKYKSEEFLMLENRQKDKDVGDVEDLL